MLSKKAFELLQSLTRVETASKNDAAPPPVIIVAEQLTLHLSFNSSPVAVQPME